MITQIFYLRNPIISVICGDVLIVRMDLFLSDNVLYYTLDYRNQYSFLLDEIEHLCYNRPYRRGCNEHHAGLLLHPAGNFL